jgi:hypothetical protein
MAALGCTREEPRRPTAGATLDTARPARAPVIPATLTVADCAPCRVRIQSGAPEFDLRFVLDSVRRDERSLRAIDVTRPDRPGWTQRLVASELPTASATDSFHVRAEDIDFDGTNDLSVLVSQGVANAYAAYWVFRPASETFAYVGNHAVFTRDTVAHRLSSYERGGDAGRVFERREYAFVGDSLVVVEVETQAATSRDGFYRRTISRIDGGRLRVVRVDTVRANDKSVPKG